MGVFANPGAGQIVQHDNFVAAAGKAIGWYDEAEAAGFIAAIVGAFLILLIYRLVLRRRG